LFFSKKIIIFASQIEKEKIETMGYKLNEYIDAEASIWMLKRVQHEAQSSF